MVRETRYLIVRNLPENCTEETVIDHFQRYGKIQSVKLQPAKENDAGSTATVAFNDIRSAAKAHHAKNSLGEVTLRTDYWEGSSGTAVLANPPGTPSGAANSGRATSYTSATAASSRPVSTFSSWNKGVSEDSTNSQDKGDTIQSSSSAGGGVVAPATASSALDKLPSTPLELQRSRPRERLSKKKFGQKFEKTGSFGRHGTTTSMRCLEATRSQSEAQAAAAAAAAASSGHPATPSASSSSGGGGPGSGLGCLNPIIVSDTKEGAKDSREASRSRPHSVASPSSRHSGGGAVIKKLSNSQSRSASPSRSRSRGSRSSSSHSDSTGTSRSTSPHRSHGSCNARPQSMVGASRLVTSEAKDRRDGDDGDRRPLGICVTGLPVRSTDSSLRDGLYHEYKKHGKVTTVQVFGDGENRYAVVSFRKPEDASKALEASQGKTFFGAKIKVNSHEGVEVDDPDRLNDNDSMDEYHVKSTRTLFVGNLEKETTKQDLIDKFKQFGKIIDVDIKRQGATTAFAFVQYVDIVSVVSALKAMEGKHIGINKIKLGFGKSMPTCCVWVDNLPVDTTTRCLKNPMSRFGEVTHCYVDRDHSKGLVYFTSYEDAQHCVSNYKIRPHLMKKKLQIDFASRECQLEFLDRMEESGQLRPGERPDESRGHKFRPQRSFDSYQDDGSPTTTTTYGYSSRSQSGFPHNGRSSSSNYRSRGRQYGEAGYTEDNNYSTSSRRSRRPEEFSQPYYSSKTSGDDYDQVLREYGHSQRERRERDLSPRRSQDHPSRRGSRDRSLDRRIEGQSRRSSRDRSLERYEDRLRDRPLDPYNSRDGSPNSEHNSYRSDSRYRSGRGEDKYLPRDRFDDRKSEDKDFGHHSRTASPLYHNQGSLHSQGSRSRSNSPPTPTQEDTPMHRMFYSDDYKRSVVTDDDYDTYPTNAQKRRDLDDLTGSKPRTAWPPLSSKLGAEVAKTAAEKSRKRSHEESGLSGSGKPDPKLLSRKHDKIPPPSSSASLLELEKQRHLGRVSAKSRHLDHSGSPGSSGSHGDSEVGSVPEGDLQHLHQEKQQLLKELNKLEMEDTPTSDPDSPRSPAKVKSIAIMDTGSWHLGRDERKRDGWKRDEYSNRSSATAAHRKSFDKRRSDLRHEGSRNHFSGEDISATREDRSPSNERDESNAGDSDLDYGSDFKRSKKRRLDNNDSLVHIRSYDRQGSVLGSDEEDESKKYGLRLLPSSLGDKSSDGRSNAVNSRHYHYDGKSLALSSPCDNELYKSRLSDKDLSVIKQQRSSSSKSISQFSGKELTSDFSAHKSSTDVYFSPAISEEHTQDSVTSGSYTEKSSKHLSPLPWQHSPGASPSRKESVSDNEFYGSVGNSPQLPDDNLSDDSLTEPLQAPGERTYEERIRAIDEILNQPVSKSSVDSLRLSSGLGNRDITNNNESSSPSFSNKKTKTEPSVIMQQMLSKKSILDQDFKRLEQMNKTEAEGGKEIVIGILPVPSVKSEAISPNTLCPRMGDVKPDWSAKSWPLRNISPSSLSDPFSVSSVCSSGVQPVTTCSSMLQPTITTTVAGLGALATPASTSVFSAPVVTCVQTSHSSGLSSSQVNALGGPISGAGLVTTLDYSGANRLNNTSLSSSSSSLFVKQEVSSLPMSSSVSMMSSPSVLSSSSSFPSCVSSSEAMVGVAVSAAAATTTAATATCAIVTTQHHQQHTGRGGHESKSVISSLPLPPSLLAQQNTSSTLSASSSSSPCKSHLSLSSTLTSSSMSSSGVSPHPSSSLSASFSSSSHQQNTTSSSSTHHTASASSSSLLLLSPQLSASGNQSANGSSAAAPFTHGPSKSQLMPTVGQEAPSVLSPSFLPENSRTEVSNLPGSVSGKDCASTNRTAASAAGLASAGVGLKGEEMLAEKDKDSGSDGCSKANLKEERKSDTSSVPLSSSSSISPGEELLSSSSSSNSASRSSSQLTPGSSSSGKVSSPHPGASSLTVCSAAVKPPSIEASEDKLKSLSNSELLSKAAMVEVSTDKSTVSDASSNVVSLKTTDKTETSDLLSGSKKTDLSPPVTTQTVLSVSNRESSQSKDFHNGEDVTSGAGKGSSKSVSSVGAEVDTTTAQLAASSSSSSTSSSFSKPLLMSSSSSSSSSSQAAASSSSSSSTTSSWAGAPNNTTASTVGGRGVGDKKSSKSSSHNKSSSNASKSEPLFTPDPKSSDNNSSNSSSSKQGSHHSRDTHDGKHKSSSQSRQSSSSVDRKSPKPASRENHDKKEHDRADKKSSEANSHKSKDGEKSKVKERRDQSKDGDKNKVKKEEESKKKEEKKAVEKKEEKKSYVKEEKKDKNADGKKEKNAEKEKEKSKDASKSASSGKNAKVESDSGKKDNKKSKEKSKESQKDKEKSGEKKLLSGLSCLTKHSTPEPASKQAKSEQRISSESKSSSKADSAKEASKNEKEGPGDGKAPDTPVKSEQKVSKSDSSKHKGDSKSAKNAADSSSKSEVSSSSSAGKKSEGSSGKSKNKEGEKESFSKSSSSKEKQQKLKQREEEKQKERQRLKEEREKQKEKEEKERKEQEEKEKQKEREEKERLERERKEREEEERLKKEKEERERLKLEKEERERKEKEREERERKEKEREERERKEREKEEKERKEREEKERLKKEKEEKERQKQKEREEREAQKEKERQEKERERQEKEKERQEKEKERQEKERKEREDKEKQKEKERKEKEKKEKEKKEKEKKEKERKEKERKAKEEKMKKEKEEKAKKEKEEKLKKEKEKKEKEKEKKEKEKERDKEKDRDKEKEDKKEKEERREKEKEERREKEKEERREKEKERDKDRDSEDKKKPPPKKPKRNELAALLDSNDKFQMTFTSMYDRVKTQRNREPDSKSEPAPKSSFDKFKQNRHKKGSKAKSSLYSFDSTSDNSEDNASDLSESESSQKAESVKETKPVKTKSIKKRPHVSSSSSSSCEDDDDALLRATKPKGKPTGKFNQIYASSDSEEESFQSPSSKSRSAGKSKGKPTPKRRKTRDDSTDSMASRDDFVKPQTLSSVTEPDSMDDIDLSEEEEAPKVSKVKKRKAQKSGDGEKRDSSIESVRKVGKVEVDSSVESSSKKPAKTEKKSKGEATKKGSEVKEESKVTTDEKKKKSDPEKVEGNKKESKVDNEKVKASKTEDDSEKAEDKKKKKEDSSSKKKKKKKYDPKEEEELVNSLITKVYDKMDKDKKQKKKKVNIFDSESEDLAGSETGMDVSASSSAEDKVVKEVKLETVEKVKESKPETAEPVKSKNKDKDAKSEKAVESKHVSKKQEGKKKDQEKKDQERKEVEKKEQLEKKENERKENEKKENERKENEKKESEKKESEKKESEKKESEKKDQHKDGVSEKKLEHTRKDHADKKDKAEASLEIKGEKEVKAEVQAEETHSKQPKKKKKKKELEKVQEKEKFPEGKNKKKSASEKKLEPAPSSAVEKKSEVVSGGEKQAADDSNKSQPAPAQEKADLDEFTSFWGHPKPILIPKRFRETKKSDDKKSDDDKLKEKSSEESTSLKGDQKSDGSDEGAKVKEEVEENDSKKSVGDETQNHQLSDLSPSAVKTPDSAATPKVESDAGDDLVIPISEAETTVITEIAPPASSDSVVSLIESVSAAEEGASEDMSLVPDETTIGSSVEINDDDDFPSSLVIDEVSDSGLSEKKKMTKKEKKLLKKQQEKEKYDRVDEIIAQVAAAESSEDEESGGGGLKSSPVSLLIDSASNDQELLLEDVINQQLKYDSKPSSESGSSEKPFTERENKKSGHLSSSFSGKDVKEKKDAILSPTSKKDWEKKKDTHKYFDLLDEETKKKDEEQLKLLEDVLSIDKPVTEEKKLSKEELKKKEEEEKRKAEEEKKKAEEEEKARKEKEEQAMREASDEAERAVGYLLEFQRGFDQDSMDMEDDLPPLFIESEEKVPSQPTPMETSPAKEKNELGVSIFSSPVPEKVSTTLEDSLLQKEDLDKIDLNKEIPPVSGLGILAGKGGKVDPFNLFTSPSQQTSGQPPASAPAAPAGPPPFSSPRRNSVPVAKDKTPEPAATTMQSPLRQMQSPQRQQGQGQSPQRPAQSPQRPSQSPQRPMQSPQRQMQSPQRQMQSPQRPMQQSPQQPIQQSPQQQSVQQSPQQQVPQSPQRPMQSPQRHMQSPQRQMPSPQRQPFQQKPPTPHQSPQVNMQSPQPLLQSPQRSPFFSAKDRSFLSPNRELPPSVEPDVPSVNHMGPQQLPQSRRSSFGLPPHGPDPVPDPLLLSTRRKSQEMSVEPVSRSPRRNTIAAPEDVTSVANLDRPGQHPGLGVVFKDRQRGQSPLPPPVSISLDNALHDKNFQSPMRSLTIPPHQENVLPNQKKTPPAGLGFKDHTSEPPGFQSPPNKGPLHDPLFHSPKEPLQEQMFSHQIKSPPDPALLTNKVLTPEQLLACNRVSLQDKLLRSGKGPPPPPPPESLSGFGKGPPPVTDKVPSIPGSHPAPEFLHGKVLPPADATPFSFTKSLQSDSVFGLGKGPGHHEPMFSPPRTNQLGSEPPFPPPGKGPSAGKEAMFSPKGLLHGHQENTMNYPEQPIDFLLNSPPRNAPGFFNKTQGGVKASSDDPFNHDPLFQVVSEASGRIADRDPPAPRRLEGFPASFYQEPTPSKRLTPESQVKSQPLSSEEDKKGAKKKRRNKETSKEDRAAALAKQQLIEESVLANVESIHKAYNANQARAAAEKAGISSVDRKKSIDAYDFDSQAGQEPNNLPGSLPGLDMHTPLFDREVKSRRNERAPRGRGGTGSKRGRRNRGGGLGPVHDLRDNGLRTEPAFPLQQQQPPQLPPPPPHLQNADHTPLPPHQQPGYPQPAPGALGQHPAPMFGGPQKPPTSQPASLALMQPQQQQQQQQPFHPQLPRLPGESSGNAPSSDRLQKPPVQIPAQHSPQVQQQPPPVVPPAQDAQQHSEQLPPSNSLSSKMGVVSPEGKLDLDSSYGEPELVINLDEGPASLEGKENQYTQGSDTDDRSVPSPATGGKTQRSTRARKVKDYRAIAAGTAQGPVQPRVSRSGSSPRGRAPGGQSPKSGNSPRTRSSENSASSPVVKLEKLEYGRGTRRSRSSAKEEGEEESSSSTFEEWKGAKSQQPEPQPKSKDIYKFDDTEQEQRVQPTSFRTTRGRKKKVLENQSLDGVAPPELPPASPASSSNSSSVLQENAAAGGRQDGITLRSGVQAPSSPSTAEEETSIQVSGTPTAAAKSSPLSNMDAIIDAVSKGIFGGSEEESTPETPVAVTAPPPARLTRQSIELVKESLEKSNKTVFPGSEPQLFVTKLQQSQPQQQQQPQQPSTQQQQQQRKNKLVVPPLRIKKEEKHYVIEQGGEKSSLAMTIKLSDSGTATIKPVGGGGGSSATTTPTTGALEKTNVPAGLKDPKSGSEKPAGAQELGLFSGVAVDPEPVKVTPSLSQTRKLDELSMAPSPSPVSTVPLQVQKGGKEGGVGAVSVPTLAQTSLSQPPPSPHLPMMSSGAASMTTGLPVKSSAVNPAGSGPQALKQVWTTQHQEALQRRASPSPHLPPQHMANPPQLPSPGLLHQPQRPPSSHQEAPGKRPPSVHGQPPLRPGERQGKGGKHGVLDIPADLAAKNPETQKLRPGMFGFGGVPPAHSSQRPFMMPPDQQGAPSGPPGHHPMHYPGPTSTAKSPSIPLIKAGNGDVRSRTPPVTSAMLYAGVVSDPPHSLSPTSASPEGQVIERLPNPMRQGEPGPSSSPFRLTTPHHQDPSRFIKDDLGRDGHPSAHGERPASHERAYQQMVEHRHLQHHLLALAQHETALSAAEEEFARSEANRNAEVARNLAAVHTAMRGHEPARSTPGGHEAGRKGALPVSSQTMGHNQALNLSETDRGTPKSTPPQSPFSMSFMDRKSEAGRGLPAGVPPSAFMQPSPGGHRPEGLPPHLYPPDLPIPGLPHGAFSMVSRLPIDPRSIYGQGQQPPPPHILASHFPQFPPGARFPGLEQHLGEKKAEVEPGSVMLRSPSPSPTLPRQMQSDLILHGRMSHDHPARDSPVVMLQRYPVMWQGSLALKNDQSYVQMHFIAGNRHLPKQALPQPMHNGVVAPLRISQRMRLEQTQLEGVAKRMQCEDDYCILIAVACGRDQMDLNKQTRALNEGFITYLNTKQAAGIVNVPLPGSEQAGFVVHIFPPCEFVDNSVAQQGSVALMEQLREHPHAVVIIATT